MVTIIKTIPKMEMCVNCINTSTRNTFLNYLVYKLTHFVCYLLCTTLQISSLFCRAKDLSSIALPAVMTLIPSC